VLDAPLLLPGPHKRGTSGFSRFGHAIGLNQEQFSVPEFEERFATLWISAPAEHIFTTSCYAKNEFLEASNGTRNTRISRAIEFLGHAIRIANI
jgi:hypothetical protein